MMASRHIELALDNAASLEMSAGARARQSVIASRNVPPSAAALATVAIAVALAGCSTLARELRPWESVTPSSRYDPALSTSRQCIDAAKRATYYCDRVNKEPDMRVQNADVYACNDAERDFYRYCR